MVTRVACRAGITPAQARLAIAAMLEPTQAMEAAALAIADEYPFELGPATFWRVMARAALQRCRIAPETPTPADGEAVGPSSTTER